MTPYLVQTPVWLPWLHHPALEWAAPSMVDGQPAVYLTFDDGPHPEITSFVLQQLASFQALATFFCIGNNVARFPSVFRELSLAGHALGHHTYNHANGGKTPVDEYVAEAAKAAALVPGPLFRPPYGRITRAQASRLYQPPFSFRIVMWSLLSGDFDTNLSPDRCLLNVTKYLRPGSIVVFHDSEKAWPRLRYALPLVLEHCRLRGFLPRPLLHS